MKYRYLILAAICGTLASCGDKDEDTFVKPNEAPDSTKVEVGIQFNEKYLGMLALQTRNPEYVVSHTNYTASFNYTTYCPNWVGWILTKERITGEESRTDNFKADPLLPKEYQIVTTDYSNSGYDRGHMCPAADNKNSLDCMKESFYMSNMCPQTHNLNAGDWSELEDQCRQWVMDYTDLYIVAGPIYDTTPYKTIGKAGRPQIAVPDRFYKVILMLGSTPKALGFIYPNDKTNRDMRDYCVSVDEVERITGIDFYPQLNDEVEKKVESECSPGAWGI